MINAAEWTARLREASKSVEESEGVRDELLVIRERDGQAGVDDLLAWANDMIRAAAFRDLYLGLVVIRAITENVSMVDVAELNGALDEINDLVVVKIDRFRRVAR